jgi:hypothetical protein
MLRADGAVFQDAGLIINEIPAKTYLSDGLA